MQELAVKNGFVYQNSTFSLKNVYVNDGKISQVSTADLPAERVVDATGQYVIPGLIDPHVHFAMDTQFARSADDFASGTLAAAYGGITTIIDFLDEAEKPEDIGRLFKERQALAQDVCIDYGLHAAVKDPATDPDGIARAALGLGMPTIKLYTTYKGSYSSPATVEAMISRSAERDIMILCHSEKDEMLDFSRQELSAHSNNRPPASEVEQVRDIADWVRQYRGLAYIVHTSCGSTLEMLKADFPELLGKDLFIEGCPQYFYFNDGVYSGSNAALYTMTPPLRPAAEQDLLRQNWQSVDSFATDHCPFLKKYKLQDSLHNIPMGAGGVEHSFTLLYTLFGDPVIERFTENTARLHGLYPRKGVLKPGSDADITIFRKAENIQQEDHSAADYSIYADIRRDIEIVSVLVRGSFVIEEGQHRAQQGMYLERRIK